MGYRELVTIVMSFLSTDTMQISIKLQFLMKFEVSHIRKVIHSSCFDICNFKTSYDFDAISIFDNLRQYFNLAKLRCLRRDD